MEYPAPVVGDLSLTPTKVAADPTHILAAHSREVWLFSLIGFNSVGKVARRIGRPGQLKEEVPDRGRARCCLQANQGVGFIVEGLLTGPDHAAFFSPSRMQVLYVKVPADESN